MAILIASVALVLVIALLCLAVAFLITAVAGAATEALAAWQRTVELERAGLQQAITEAQRATSEAQGAVVTDLLGQVLAVLAPREQLPEPEPNGAEQLTIPDSIFANVGLDADERDWTDHLITADGWTGDMVAVLAPGEGPLDHIFNKAS